MNVIENVTDQLKLYVGDVEREVKKLTADGEYTQKDAIEIVKIAADNMRTEVFHHIYASLLKSEINLGPR